MNETFILDLMRPHETLCHLIKPNEAELPSFIVTNITYDLVSSSEI